MRGEKHPVVLAIENRSKGAFNGRVRDDEPPGLTEEGAEFPLQIPSRSCAGAIHYSIVPAAIAAAFSWNTFTCRAGKPLEALDSIYSPSLPRSAARLSGALKQIGRYAMYARLNRMSLLGVRRQRRIGTDNEFESLRDYTPDDQFRSIDWRATGRRLKLTVRDFQTNQSQRVIFLIDCGRMMVNQSGGQSLLDAAFDAALTLSYVTLAQNDQVGLLCFADGVLRWLPPSGGRRQLNRMVHAVYDVHPEFVESRFDEAFMHLHRHCRKRTLVVLITNVIDDQNANRLKSHVANLLGRHLPLTVLLRDHELFDPVEQLDETVHLEGKGSPEMYRAAAAAEILCWRRKVLNDLRQSKALTLDCFPSV